MPGKFLVRRVSVSKICHGMVNKNSCWFGDMPVVGGPEIQFPVRQPPFSELTEADHLGLSIYRALKPRPYD
jgi:hypothetical protein